jgi:Tol biopolymer transport system component
MKRIFQIVMCLLALFLAACNLEGVASFSPNNDRVAVVTKVGSQYRLETTDANGGNVVKIEDNVQPAFDVTFDPLGTKLLYVANSQVCTVDPGGSGKTCPVALGGGTSGGFISFLPDGDYIFAYRTGSQWQMDIYQPGVAAPHQSEVSVDHFFLTSNAYKVKRGSKGTQWYLKLYNKPSGQQNLRWVIIKGTQAIMYNAAGSLEGPTPLARVINSAVQDALKNRDQTDITSGAISPDGTKLVFRTRTGADPNYSYGLYALDLSVNTGSFVQLVNNANFRIQFAFSPTGQEVVYESNDGGNSVWLANADGSNPRKLADGATLPDWH